MGRLGGGATTRQLRKMGTGGGRRQFEFQSNKPENRGWNPNPSIFLQILILAQESKTRIKICRETSIGKSKHAEVSGRSFQHDVRFLANAEDSGRKIPDVLPSLKSVYFLNTLHALYTATPSSLPQVALCACLVTPRGSPCAGARLVNHLWESTVEVDDRRVQCNRFYPSRGSFRDHQPQL